MYILRLRERGGGKMNHFKRVTALLLCAVMILVVGNFAFASGNAGGPGPGGPFVPTAEIIVETDRLEYMTGETIELSVGLEIWNSSEFNHYIMGFSIKIIYDPDVVAPGSLTFDSEFLAEIGAGHTPQISLEVDSETDEHFVWLLAEALGTTSGLSEDISIATLEFIVLNVPDGVYTFGFFEESEITCMVVLLWRDDFVSAPIWRGLAPGFIVGDPQLDFQFGQPEISLASTENDYIFIWVYREDEVPIPLDVAVGLSVVDSYGVVKFVYIMPQLTLNPANASGGVPAIAFDSLKIGDEVKVMLWDNVRTMRPLADYGWAEVLD